MAFIHYKAKENSSKCSSCKFNFVNSYKIDEKSYAHYLKLDDKIAKAAVGVMWASCKVCPNRKDFEKMYGVEPIKFYTAAMG